MKVTACLLLALILSAVSIKFADAQYPSYYQYNVLPTERIADLIIGEASGERAHQHIVSMAGYARLRNVEEFSGDLMETTYLVSKLREYGLKNITVDRFGTTRSWQGISASLWEKKPFIRKIADLVESPLMLASGSGDIDVEAELVWADAATVAAGFGSIDITGKIILTPERPSTVLSRAMQAGAAAIITFYSPRPLENSIMIPAASAGGRGGGPPGTVFYISPREGELLMKRILAGEKIIINAQAKTTYVDAELQVTSCLIEGSDPDPKEIIITAHVFEGYVKTGGNDNISGSAAILETARVLNHLIESGSIPRPSRSIRFLWIPEFSGTIPWVAANRKPIDHSLCNINLDMVGLSLAKWRSFFVLHRTSYGNAHYVGDVVGNLFRYVGETNKVNSVVSGSRFFRPITAPTGTDDPFYYEIESASGGSDHMVFNDLGVMVPGIMIITWPDPFYHTSEDLADKCDPTQLKRTVFITAGSAYAIAAAGKREAVAIAGEVAANGVARMGIIQSAAADMISGAGREELHTVARFAAGKIRGTALGEIMTINSVRELAPGDADLIKLLDTHAAQLKRMAEGQLKMIADMASSVSASYGLPAYNEVQTAQEKRAAAIRPTMSLNTRDEGYRAFQNLNKMIAPEDLTGVSVREIADPQEAIKLVNGANSILDIKYILDAQYSRETNCDVLLSWFNALKNAGVVSF